MPSNKRKKSVEEPVPQDADSHKIQSVGKNEFRLFNKPNSPYLHVRVMVEGKRRQFSTGEKTKRAAQSKVLAIMADIKSRGFQEAVQLHSRKKKTKKDWIDGDPTLEELGRSYESNIRSFEKPLSIETARYYTTMLKRIGKLAGVSRVSHLTPDAIQEAKEKYIKRAEEDNRDLDSAKITLAAIIRNAAGVFSRQSLEVFRQQGLELTNPFSGKKVRGTKVKSYRPMSREFVTKIWTKASTLLEGDPDAGAPHKDDHSKTDFRQPQPAVFALLILELGLGLRRNEADKARWDWFFQIADGRRFIEVRETDDFKPKSRQSRVIPVADEVWDALAPLANDDSIYIVPGPLAAKPSKKLRRTYRCENSHRSLVFWLKQLGVTDPKPCHALRKEFGSYVATQFSLFHAQKLLGHSTPVVTSDYYASLTDLPQLQPSQMGSNSHERKESRKENNPEEDREKGSEKRY